ncbi:MAG: hypothetical protein AAF478_09715 [Pseudomonadota bacterium]
MNTIEQISVVQQRENIIASACKQLAEDLKSIPPLAYAFFFNIGDMPVVFEQINTLIEQRFKGGTMSFPCTGECELNWEQLPIVSIDLEFADPEVSVFFRLSFADNGLAVNLHHISFPESAGDPALNTSLLEKHLAAAAA